MIDIGPRLARQERIEGSLHQHLGYLRGNTGSIRGFLETSSDVNRAVQFLQPLYNYEKLIEMWTRYEENISQIDDETARKMDGVNKKGVKMNRSLGNLINEIKKMLEDYTLVIGDLQKSVEQGDEQLERGVA